MKDKENPMRASRMTVTFLACMLMTYACCELLDGINAQTPQAALLAGAALGIAYLILRPVLRLLTIPIGCLTLGLSNFAIDIGLLYLCSALVSGFAVDGILWAAGASLAINAVVLIAGGWK